MIMSERIGYISTLPSSGSLDNQDCNKICQWCCCNCYQSYGSILYTSALRPPISPLSPTHREVHNLLYYSQLAYGIHDITDISSEYHQHDHKVTSDNSNLCEAPSSSSQNTNTPEYTHELVTSQNSFSSNRDTPKSISALKLHLQESAGSSTEQSTVLRNPNIILKEPTRFNCHRCNHMMCPYCPKVRIRDLQR
ncbi:uncharacterized protein RJT21DRAFT_114923 [Scheffersomyces amazonensis]|uniref:uncharacterized protein n=1 Tax=Scheffersomyces amazonensis TaxID=1078765 RepID=UPI00315D83A5